MKPEGGESEEDKKESTDVQIEMIYRELGF
jgi:hypothetical protein